MSHFTPLPALAGGLLIGLAAAILLLANGELAGISGIVSGLLRPSSSDGPWRWFFVGGLVAGGVVIGMLYPSSFSGALGRSSPALAAAGLLVGFGTRLGGGCTSGHGVCGLARFSTRSLVATVTFMALGAVTVLVINRVLGGAL